ncbi:MAG: hypothetical protein A2X48_04750 [Lentisphaerae bacterium GWF2_49_21]|nr:MAG: hypothetical protein A2X48_04750 [Lentisphaerae bacterium GWF2_49_21]
MDAIWNGFFSELSGDMKFYWALALFGSFIFLIQLVMAMFGFGAGHDVDTSAAGGHDVDATGHADAGFSIFKLFSVQSVVAFITFFGWGGVIWGKNGLTGFFAALACGLFMMFATSFILYYLMKLQQSGNIEANDFIGCSGTVYMNIPAGRTQSGKVTVNFKGCTREITAVADDELPTGTAVTIAQQIDGRRFLVKKI